MSVKTNEQIKKDLQQFATEIMRCDDPAKAIEIDQKVNEYFASNEVPDEVNILLNDGYGEMLRMMVLASERH